MLGLIIALGAMVGLLGTARSRARKGQRAQARALSAAGFAAACVALGLALWSAYQTGRDHDRPARRASTAAARP